MKISLWGAGLLGKPILLRLSEFYNISVSNRTHEKVKDLDKLGIKVLDFDESLKNTNTIILVLTDYKAIEETLLKNKNLLSGKTIIQMGTILPNESKNLIKEITNYGGNYIEAPVLGSGREAEKGKLIIMVSGLKNIFEKYNELFNHLGEVYYIGSEIGKSSTIKLALNQLIASLTSSFSYSLSLILKEKIDFNIFMNILRDSALYAPTFDKKLSKMINNDFLNPNFPLKHLLKDVQLVKKLGDNLNINNEIINAIEKILEKKLSKYDIEEKFKMYDVLLSKLDKMIEKTDNLKKRNILILIKEVVEELKEEASTLDTISDAIGNTLNDSNSESKSENNIEQSKTEEKLKTEEKGVADQNEVKTWDWTEVKTNWEVRTDWVKTSQ